MKTMQNKLSMLCAGFTAVMLVFAAIGCLRAYTPIPMWDMWDGTVGFLNQVENGNEAIWWSQFNEHRIILSRLLFWIDAHWFGGKFFLLFAAIYLLIGLIAFMFWRLLETFATDRQHPVQERNLALIMTGWLFLWTQADNFTWAFQSQFLLAQYLPLCAFFWLYRSAQQPTATHYFLIASVLGVISAGAMANGTLVLPLMLVFALLTGQAKGRIATLLLLSVITLTSYFHDYHAIKAHGTLTHELVTNPISLLHFIFLYLGAPFYYVAGKWITGKIIATCMGILLCILILRLTAQQWRAPNKNLLTLMLLMFVAYVMASAVATAGGRLVFGLDTAINLRYGTPVLMAWAAMAIIYRPRVLAWLKLDTKTSRFCLGIFLLSMLATQANALRSLGDAPLERKVAVLALELGIHDEQQIHFVYPFADQLEAMIRQYRAKKLSVLGQSPYHGLSEQIGRTAAQSPVLTGEIVQRDALSTPTGAERIRGWIGGDQNAVPSLIALVDADQKIIGFAMVEARSDTRQYRFKGYLVGKPVGDIGLTNASELPISN